MQFKIPKLNVAPEALMKKCGYNQIQNPLNKEWSYARNIDPGRFYPRFHVYINKLPDKIIEINLHLDMKKPSYEGSSAHSGEYSGEIINNEFQRIKNIAEKFLVSEPKNEPVKLKPLKPWWKFWR